MKINKFFLGLLGMAAFTFAACSDSDDDYSPATVSGEQVFFPSTVTSQINLSETATSFNIPLKRQVADAASTVNLITEDPSGKFTVPQSVTFEAGSQDTVITVTYDPAQFVYAQLDTVTITIEEAKATPYGLTSYTFIAGIPEPFVSIGKAKYYDGFLMDGGPYEVEILRNKNNPNQYRIMHPYDEAIATEKWPTQGNQSESITLTLLQPGEKLNDTEITKTGLVYFTGTNSGYYNTSNDYNQDIMLYHASEFSKLQAESDWAGSYVSEYQDDGTPGVVLLGAYYYMEGIGGWNYTTQPLVQIIFPGYDPKDYSVEVNYLGKFIDPADHYFANFSINMGPDVESVKYALVEGKDVDAALSGIISGTIESAEITESSSVQVPVEVAGTYTLMAVAYADNEAQNAGYTTIKFEIGASEWQSLGIGLFTDDIYIPRFSDNDGNQMQPVTYEVEIEASSKTPGLYRLVNPYCEPYPYNDPGDWDASQNWNIEVNAVDPEGVYIEAQDAGLDWGKGMLSILSMGYYLMAAKGNSFEDVKAAGYMGTLVDGIITFPVKGLLYAIGDDGYYYGNVNGQTKIVLPSAVPSEARKTTIKQHLNRTGKMYGVKATPKALRLLMISSTDALNK